MNEIVTERPFPFLRVEYEKIDVLRYTDIKPPELGIIGGQRSIGKTTLLAKMASDALQCRDTILFISAIRNSHLYNNTLNCLNAYIRNANNGSVYVELSSVDSLIRSTRGSDFNTIFIDDFNEFNDVESFTDYIQNLKTISRVWITTAVNRQSNIVVDRRSLLTYQAAQIIIMKQQNRGTYIKNRYGNTGDIML